MGVKISDFSKSQMVTRCHFKKKLPLGLLKYVKCYCQAAEFAALLFRIK